MSPLRGEAPPLVETSVSTREQLLRCGLEAWLGYHALRRAGCQECVPCASPTGQALLEFYIVPPVPTPQGQGYEESGYIGANWFVVQYKGPDNKRRVPWMLATKKPVEGILGEGSALADHKSLHYRHADGRIMTRFGEVAPAPKGTTFGDRGALVNPAGVASHSNVRVPYQLWDADAALVSWGQEHIDLTPAQELPTDNPDATLWAYPNYSNRLPNLWLQEHP